MEKTIIASELIEGDRFRQFRQRKWRTVHKIIHLKETDNIPDEHKGKLLIIVDRCRQIMFAKNQNLIKLTES